MRKGTIPAFERLDEKTALNLYTNYLMYRYNFSRVITESLYKDALYFQLLFDKAERTDGQIIYYGVDHHEPAGKALKDCEYIKLKLTIRHADDAKIRYEHGLLALRRQKMQRLSEEAVVQGAALSQEDLAELLCTDRSTILRDIAYLRTQGIEILTRAHFTDQGRGSSHKERIIKLFLRGFTITEISNRSEHDLKNVQNYIYDFLRIGLLYQEEKPLLMIARLTKRSYRLVEEHIALYEKLRQDSLYADSLSRQMSFYASQLHLQALKKSGAA